MHSGNITLIWTLHFVTKQKPASGFSKRLIKVQNPFGEHGMIYAFATKPDGIWLFNLNPKLKVKLRRCGLKQHKNLNINAYDVYIAALLLPSHKENQTLVTISLWSEICLKI